MNKKRLFKGLVLLFSSSLALGTFLSLRLTHKKDNINVVLAYEGTPLPTSGTLSAGTYYLDSDSTIVSQLRITSGDVIVNLNGHTLNGGGKDKGIFYVTGGTLTVNGKDDETGNRGTLNNGGGYYPGSGYSYGGALYITAGGATFNDLDITNCQANWGGAIQLSNSAVTLNNCNLSGNFTTNGYGFYGAISVGDSSTAGTGLTVNGGELFSNDGGIYVGGKAKATINGAYIHDNDNYGVGVGSDAGGLTISGNTIIEDNNPSSGNLKLNGDNPIKVGIVSELGNDAHIGVTLTNNTGVFTSGWSTYMSGKDPADYFFSDNSSYAIGLQDGEACVELLPPAASISDGTTVTNYNNFNDALAAWTDGTTLTLLKDVTTSDTINANNNVTLDLNGYGIKATGTDYSVLTINNGGKLTIIDSGDTTQYFTIVDRYDGNGAGFATVCDKATYDAADENLRGTFQGGYITGGNIISTGFYQSKAGAITVMTGGELDFKAGTIIGNSGGTESPGGVSSFGTFTLNGGNIIYNRGRRGSGVFVNEGTFVMNSGSIEYNTGVGANEYGTTAFHAYGAAESISFNGGSISHNYAKYGGIATASNIFLSGDFVAVDNVACGPSGTGAANGNIMLGEGALLRGCITGNTPIGINLDIGSGVFTNNTDTSLNDPSKFVSDNPNYAIGVYPAGHTKEGQIFIGNKVTITYTTEHGTAPDSDTVANGSLIYNEPTSPSEEGYEFKGWYKDEEFENAWDFETDTVTSDTTLYAKWDYDEATANVIKLINDIGDLTYAGGVDDSLDDIIAAKAAYDALTPGRKEIVNGVNKDDLDHDIVTYNHVDKVGDLIKAIPEASDSQEYYDAIETALAAYKALTDEEKAILNAGLDFQYKKTLDDNIAAKEVIELIKDIGEVTYKGGQDDSKDDINTAVDAYNNLTDDQKEIVKNVNKDELDDAKETYDNVDEAVNLINSIGDINHGGEDDSKEAINAAREAYDNLSDEEKALANAFNNSNKTLEDAEEVYDVLVKIDDIGESNDEEKIKAAREAYDALTPEQKDQVGDKYVQKLITAENHSKDANILFIVFLILFILLIVSGLIVMYILLKRRKNENNDNNKQVKLASVSGLLPLVVLASYFTSSKFILVYVLGAVAILIWLTNLILFVSKKRQKEAKLEFKPETVVLTTPQAIQNELVTEVEEEVAPEIIPEDAKEEVISKVQDKEVIKHHESISVSKADEEMSDEKAESSIEEVEVIKPRKGKKEIINIDTLSENYNNGDEVTLESLIKKGLVPATTGRIKVLARGVLDKKLDVIADDFSIPAIKMIVLVGGHVKKIK